MKVCLVVIDMQKDFCAKGTLPVPGAEEIIPVINSLYRYGQSHDWEVFCTKDDHPANSQHFVTHGGVWPEHCVHDTSGAELHPDLNLPTAKIVLKGTKIDEDGFSGFDGHLADTGQPLDDYLKQQGIDSLNVVGVATDYCVKAFVLDALKRGYAVYLLTNAIRAVNLQPTDGQEAIKAMRVAGAIVLEMIVT